MLPAGPEAEAETFLLARVGTFRSSFPAPFGCPRQGLAAPSVRGRVELSPWIISAGGGSAHSLEGLEGFSHVWIIFLFDRNRHSSASFDLGSSFLRPTVRPPWLAGDDGKRGSTGVFATRSPHRPNPIGLTVCRLDHVDHATATVFLSGVDVVDGSAVLDIKPYHPVDLLLPPGMVFQGLALEAAGTSSSSTMPSPPNRSHVRFPGWLPVQRQLAVVTWRADALTELRLLQSCCSFYPDARDCPGSSEQEDKKETTEGRDAALMLLQRAIEEVLELDPRPPQSRSRSREGSTAHRYWVLDFDGLCLAFRLLHREAQTSGAALEGQGDPAELGEEESPTAPGSMLPVFEVVRVQPRSETGERTSKAWLEDLRLELEGQAGRLPESLPPERQQEAD